MIERLKELTTFNKLESYKVVNVFVGSINVDTINQIDVSCSIVYGNTLEGVI